MLIFGVRGRNVEQGIEVLQYCADLGNANCRFLLLALAGVNDRLGLFGHHSDGPELHELEDCANSDRSPLCRLALGFRRLYGLVDRGEAEQTASGCDAAAIQYRIAADHAVMFSQEDAGSGPLHSVRLLEFTAVAAEQVPQP